VNRYQSVKASYPREASLRGDKKLKIRILLFINSFLDILWDIFRNTFSIKVIRKGK